MHDKTPGANGSGQDGFGIAAELEEEALRSVLLNDHHATETFCCSKSERVQGFLRTECRALITNNYCRVFVLEDLNDQTQVMGNHSL